MKKLLLSMLAIAAMIATSCEKALDEGANANESATVTFQVGTHDITTRAYADGKSADNLAYAVYDKAGNLLTDGEEEFTDLKTSVKLELMTDTEYDVVFWAYAEGAPYTVDFAKKTMTVDYTKTVSNDEKCDAFYAALPVKVTGAQTENVELRRPFAQLNIGTNDFEAAKGIGFDATESMVKVKNICSTMNLLTGEASGEVEATFDWANIPSGEKFPVAGYEYLSMNYLLVNAEKEVVDVTFGYADNKIQKTRTVGSVPVQRNYRTNIYGKLLTSDVNVNIEIKPGFADDNYAYVTSSEAFKAALNSNAKVINIILGADVTIDIQARDAAPMGGVDTEVINIDGNGKKLTFNQTNSDWANVFCYGKLNLKNMTIEKSGYGTNGGAWNTHVISFNCEVEMENVTVNHAMGVEKDAKLKNVAITEDEEYYGLWVTAEGQTVDIDGLSITATNGGRAIKVADQYVGTPAEVTLNIKNSTFETAKKAAVLVSSKAGAVINWGTGNSIANVAQDSTNAVWVDEDYASYDDKVIVNGASKKIEGAVYASTLADVKDVFANGGNIVLEDDIEFEKITPIEAGKEVYLNLNGKTITVDENTTSNTLIWVKEGGKLIVDGNGTIDLGDVSTMAIFCPYGELVIENGTFIRNKVTTLTDDTVGIFLGSGSAQKNMKVTINGGYFDGGYYDANAADIEEILAGTKAFTETADDVAKRDNPKDANLVRVALKDNVSTTLNHSGWGSFKVYGGTFVGANPAWGDEGCMLPTTPNYLRPWSYYQGALLDGQTFNENGLVIPTGYEITKGATADGRPTYTVTYNK